MNYLNLLIKMFVVFLQGCCLEVKIENLFREGKRNIDQNCWNKWLSNRGIRDEKKIQNLGLQCLEYKILRNCLID